MTPRHTPNMDRSNDSTFPWRNPINAYFWGFIHGMVLITLLLSGLLYILL